MWQRLTERARGSIAVAREEAIKAGWGQIGTEYLLLGLAADESCLAAIVLKKLGVDSYLIRHEITAELESGPELAGIEIQFSPAAGHVLEMAADEARQMQQNYIGTEHLLLALARYKEGQASRILSRMGLDLAALRQQLLSYCEHRTL